MNALRCLFWYETRRNAWVLYGAAAGLVMFAFVLILLPGVLTGADIVGIPEAGEAPDPNRSGEIRIESSRDEGGGSFISRSFEWTFGTSPDPSDEETADDASTGAREPMTDSSSTFELPDELQFALRPRQAATFIAAMFLSAATLLGFFIAHVREADRGEMTIHYQSPVAPEAQLCARFAFMAGASLAVFTAAMLVYDVVQASQSLAAALPVAEGLGAYAEIRWGNLVLASAITQVLPAAAFILLFVQLQNAYGLLGGQRLAGFVVLIAGLTTSLFCYERFGRAGVEGESVLPIIAVREQPTLDVAIGNFDLTR
ncbi:MAG: hypothetical protein QF570_22215, partial [Myxococcota bacterium]|nr:hypothetical protein [Myxococcota bacterium]